MPFDSGAIHAPQHLADLCKAYDPGEDGYLRNEFFARKDVSKVTDLVPTISKADTLRLYDLDVTSRSKVPIVTYRTGADITYRCKAIAARSELNPQDMKNADAAYRHEKRQTKQALIAVGQRMEYLAVNQTLRQTSVLTNNRTLSGGAGNRWDNFNSADSQPIEDLQAAVNVVRIKTGKSASRKSRGKIKIAMHQYTWMTLCQHPNVLSRVAYNTGQTGAILTREVLAKMLDVEADDIIASAAQYTSSVQGASTDAFLGFMGSDCVVAMVDDDAENDQALGHEFVFDGLAGEDPFLVKQWREEGVGPYLFTDWTGVACMPDYKVTNVDAGFLFKSVIDSSNTARYASLVD